MHKEECIRKEMKEHNEFIRYQYLSVDKDNLIVEVSNNKFSILVKIPGDLRRETELVDAIYEQIYAECFCVECLVIVRVKEIINEAKKKYEQGK